jgi:acyl-CoA thioesterase I
MIHYLALGDSYTIGEGVSATESFPYQLYNDLVALNVSIVAPRIIAKTGWTTTELLEGIKANPVNRKYDLVTFLIGVNNQYRGLPIEQFEVDFRILANHAIDYAGGVAKTVLAISIPDYGFTPFGESNKAHISKDLDAFNDIIKRVSDELELEYVDVTTLTRSYADHEGMLVSDNLHPSKDLYRKWVNVLTPIARYALRLR